MLLEDATSTEQVAAALEAGDEELREDIENELDDAKRHWEQTGRGYDDDIEVHEEVVNIVESEDFVERVRLRSPALYDLENIPKDDVASDLRYAMTRPRGNRPVSYGPFYVDDKGGDYFSYKFEVGGNYTFRGSFFPRNAEYIPQDIAREFWASLGDEYNWDQTSFVDRNEDFHGHGPGTEMYVEATEEKFTEWCRDIVATYIQGEIKRHPERAKERFFAGLAEKDKELAEKLKGASVSDEEILDFAGKWFEGESEQEDLLETIRDYFGILAAGASDPRTIVVEFSKEDIRAMGIKQGTFFENAPWRLIKLHPSDLRMEGTLMGHCVGKADMGYVKALSEGEIEIWSLRLANNKPRFTLEVDSSFYKADDSGTEPGMSKEALQTLTPAFYRARAITQLKGKGNREPGYADVHQKGGIKFPDEVVFWTHAFRALDVNPAEVGDFEAFTSIAGIGVDPGSAPEVYAIAAQHAEYAAAAKLQQNDGDQCVGFDRPYQRRDVRQNRRSSRRRGSRRRTSRRRSSKIRS